MWNRFVGSLYLYFFLPSGVVISTVIGYFLSNPYALPALHISFCYPVLFSLLSRSQRKRAVFVMLYWALWMGVVAVLASRYFPAHASRAVLNGPAYVQEMFYWIRTGIGAEGNPAQFLLQHAIHLALFCVLSLLTGSVLSLLMGAVLMDYMGFYVGSLINASDHPALASFMRWHPWSILRVASFVILGVILAEPAICTIRKRKYDPSGIAPYLWAAAAGLLLDVLIKATLAPWWGLELRKILHS